MAKYAGYTLQSLLPDGQNIESSNKFIQDFDEIPARPPSLWMGGLHDITGAKYLKFASRELDKDKQFQFLESDYMKAEDYDDFIENPTKWILTTLLPRLHTEFKDL